MPFNLWRAARREPRRPIRAVAGAKTAAGPGGLLCGPIITLESAVLLTDENSGGWRSLREYPKGPLRCYFKLTSAFF